MCNHDHQVEDQAEPGVEHGEDRAGSHPRLSEFHQPHPQSPSPQHQVQGQ